MSVGMCPLHIPVVFVGGQVTDAAGHEVARFTQEFQRLLFMKRTHDNSMPAATGS